MNVFSYVKLYEKIANQMPNFLGIHDLNSRLQLVNDRTAKILGFKSSNDIAGLNYENFNCKAAEDAKDFKYQDKLVFLNRKKVTFLSYHYYADGWKLILGEKSPLFDDNENLIGLTSFWMDVTNYNLIDISRFLFESLHSKIRKKSFIYHVDDNLSNFYDLSERQIECLFFLLRGKSDKEIAKILNLSPRTVESYIQEIKNKMCCTTRSQIIEKAFANGLLNVLPKRFLTA